MKIENKRAKSLSEQDVHKFLNEDPHLSRCGSIQWLKTGEWRWGSSDGLTFATSDGNSVEMGQTASGEALERLLLK